MRMFSITPCRWHGENMEYTERSHEPHLHNDCSSSCRKQYYGLGDVFLAFAFHGSLDSCERTSECPSVSSWDVWMMTKSVVSVATIVGYNCCHTPWHRAKEALDVSLGVQQPIRLPYMARVDLSRIILLEYGRRQALNIWENRGFQQLKDVALAVQGTVNAY
ncbi:hypothetical protein TNCV_896271 [Trichonephila clavipes]|nr:hypothetical protein TNCV_896271 [Trichonephila clavipes]